MSADAGIPSLEACAGLSRAVQAADDAALRTAAQEFHDAPQSLLELLRYLHLYFGFPRIIHALGVLRDAGVLPDCSDSAAAPAATPNQGGIERFRHLYREDADRVLARLEELDPVFLDWILGHAYGTTADAHQLPLQLTERVAVLALAATRCWNQCYSHLRAALRSGVTAATLDADRDAADWLNAEARQRLSRLLQRESDSAES